MASTPIPARAGVISAAVPIAAAIGVFGVVYGAAAGPLLGPWLTVISSLIVFSGVAQFTMVALVAAGATPVAILGAAPRWPCGTCRSARYCNRS